MAGTCIVCGKFLSNYCATLCDEHKHKEESNYKEFPYGYEIDVYGHIRQVVPNRDDFGDRW